MASNVAIKAIESGTVHRIQAGQVIVDLCSVAKELVENSIDAGATSIEVRFKNQGLDSIEVQDNGSGISPQNCASVALKHHTSKLSTYDDLTRLQTFGFRGEALSSLCAVSKFTVVTCTKDQAPKASKLEFEASGKLQSTSIVSGQKGTTVFVENLFHNLPVRRRELQRNIKREWGKVISLLNQYACIQTHVKFSVSQQPNKGRKIILFSTRGNPTTRENIINVFGVKSMNAMIAMNLKLELEPTSGPSQRWSTQEDGDVKEIYVRGHISRPVHGEGRQAPDRQMLYVNGRPCGLPQFSKIFNDVYRSYNGSQSPFIFADIQLDTHLYDVNVSPDKRTILLHDQGRMLDNLRESLVELFETQHVTIPIAQASASKQTPFKKLTITRSDHPTSARKAGTKDDRESSVLSTSTNTRPTQPENEDTVDDEDRDGDGGVEDEHENDDEEQTDKVRISASAVKAGRKRVSLKSLARDANSMNLITRWVERRSTVQGTGDSNGPDAEKKASNHAAHPTDKDRNVHSLKGDGGILGDADGSEDIRENILPESSETGKQETVNTGDRHSGDLPSDIVNPSSPEEHEAPVPAVLPPSQPPRPSFTSPTRPGKRPSPEVATITIGDDTVTSIIGSSAKRVKVDVAPPAMSPTKAGLIRKPTKSLPSFGDRLSQMFSASARASASSEAGDLEVPERGDLPLDEEKLMFVSKDDRHGNAVSEPEGSSDEESEPVSSNANKEESSRENRVDSDAQEVDNDQEQDSEQSESDPEGSQSPSPGDSDYVDEDAKRAQEDEKVKEIIRTAEKKALAATDETEKRSQMLVKGGKRKAATFNLVQLVQTKEKAILDQVSHWQGQVLSSISIPLEMTDVDGIASRDAEEKLALKISKSDFRRMKIIGQFNLGFILAIRESDPSATDGEAATGDDELFIIDQHASDEKYNFERLQATTTVQSQRLVQPKTLELTAMEEEIVLENLAALESNGFVVQFDESGEQPVGSRCKLLSLPLSRETTFSVADLEELIFLLGDNPSSSATTVPRPSKVRKMFAMRACRSSIMIGKALSHKQMGSVVRHMGEMEKPWNCPHGRPTMRHLCGLGGAWDSRVWTEGDDFEGTPSRPSWAQWVREKREESG